MNLSTHMSHAKTAELHLKEEWGNEKDIRSRVLIGVVKTSDIGWVILDLFSFIGNNGKEVEMEQVWTVAIPTSSIAFMFINEVTDKYKELRKKRGTLATYAESGEEPTGLDVVKEEKEPNPEPTQMKEPPKKQYTAEEVGKSGEDVEVDYTVEPNSKG